VNYGVTVRPQIMPSNGSSVHDELDYIEADSARDALRKFYLKKEYDFSLWYVIDVEPMSRKL
jgi:hypothetical protein